MSPPFDYPQLDRPPGPDLESSTKVRYLTALTPREKQVLEYVDCGYSNSEIGARLKITLDCVKFHLKNIFPKLGARSRTHAARLARQFQLIAPRENSEFKKVRIVAGRWPRMGQEAR